MLYLQDSEVTEQMVLLVLWSNLTLTKVADRWPADGFFIKNGLTFVGLPTGRVGVTWEPAADNRTACAHMVAAISWIEPVFQRLNTSLCTHAVPNTLVQHLGSWLHTQDRENENG
jgi:hypothetical protein